jgi:hypothetical protein
LNGSLGGALEIAQGAGPGFTLVVMVGHNGGILLTQLPVEARHVVANLLVNDFALLAKHTIVSGFMSENVLKTIFRLGIVGMHFNQVGDF